MPKVSIVNSIPLNQMLKTSFPLSVIAERYISKSCLGGPVVLKKVKVKRIIKSDAEQTQHPDTRNEDYSVLECSKQTEEDSSPGSMAHTVTSRAD
jgi:hypothetical protein